MCAKSNDNFKVKFRRGKGQRRALSYYNRYKNAGRKYKYYIKRCTGSPHRYLPVKITKNLKLRTIFKNESAYEKDDMTHDTRRAPLFNEPKLTKFSDSISVKVITSDDTLDKKQKPLPKSKTKRGGQKGNRDKKGNCGKKADCGKKGNRDKKGTCGKKGARGKKDAFGKKGACGKKGNRDKKGNFGKKGNCIKKCKKILGIKKGIVKVKGQRKRKVSSKNWSQVTQKSSIELMKRILMRKKLERIRRGQLVMVMKEIIPIFKSDDNHGNNNNQ